MTTVHLDYLFTGLRRRVKLDVYGKVEKIGAVPIMGSPDNR